MSEQLLTQFKKLHFIGIGGSGMCPMAELLFRRGYEITGSDLYASETLDRVKALGIPVTVGHSAKNIGDAEVVVYTAAARSDNPEIVAAKEKGVPVVDRAVMLGEITRLYALPICVSGTHGKTTTTAMLTQILLEGNLDPNAIIGGKLPAIGGNSRMGESDILVCEACEYVDTFLQLHPAISVITNIDADHLDYFKTLDNIIRSFHQFSMQTTQRIVANGDNLNVMKSLQGIDKDRIVTFGLNPHNDYYAANLSEIDTTCESFTLMHKDKALGNITLQVPGEHNLFNALAAATAAHLAGAPANAICSGLENFQGVHRRFEILGKFHGVTIADDFAHHPTELEAVLRSAMKMGYRQVWAIFQPHTYSRTYNHFDEFVHVLNIPDHLIMTEILAVREVNKYNIHTADLAARLPGSLWFSSNEEIVSYILQHAKENDLVLTLGGGNIYLCANSLVEAYQKK